MFFNYYGGKYSRSHLYPRPKYRTLVEPFAGSAGYSVRYRGHDVRLYDLDPAVIGVWNYLIRVSAEELRRLPDDVDDLDDHPSLSPEQRLLIGWWLHKRSTYPRRKVSSWKYRYPSGGKFWGQRVRDRLAVQVENIRHWTAEIMDYRDIPDVEATWFVDPPYQGRVGSYYRHRFDGHAELGEWCRDRRGQVIVCEHAGASWLPFRPLGSSCPRDAREMVWTCSA